MRQLFEHNEVAILDKGKQNELKVIVMSQSANNLYTRIYSPEKGRHYSWNVMTNRLTKLEETK